MVITPKKDCAMINIVDENMIYIYIWYMYISDEWGGGKTCRRECGVYLAKSS